jgi:hypothetical protein
MLIDDEVRRLHEAWREWLEENERRYEAVWRQSAKAMIAAFEEAKRKDQERRGC